MSDVVFIYSDEIAVSCARLPKIEGRSLLVSELVKAFELPEKMEIIAPTDVCGLQLADFHSKDYIATLQSCDALVDIDESKLHAHALEYDCPPFPKVYETVCRIAGSSITAAEELGYGTAKVAINWFGGWHHGLPNKAAGFCYVNDCVLAIRHLKNFFSKVLYVDLDLHHGDGVEQAFYSSPSVLCYSIHKHEPGFFPGTGALTDIGEGKGTGYTVNIPLKDGATDASLWRVIDGTIDKVISSFCPDVIVCQCGADGVAGDPHHAFSYTPDGMSRVVQRIISHGKPVLLLGGGGYNHANTARTWTQITADVIGHAIPSDIPKHEYFCEYGPGFDMSVDVSNKRDTNDEQYLSSVIDFVNRSLKIHLPAS